MGPDFFQDEPVTLDEGDLVGFGPRPAVGDTTTLPHPT